MKILVQPGSPLLTVYLVKPVKWFTPINEHWKWVLTISFTYYKMLTKKAKSGINWITCMQLEICGLRDLRNLLNISQLDWRWYRSALSSSVWYIISCEDKMRMKLDINCWILSHCTILEDELKSEFRFGLHIKSGPIIMDFVNFTGATPSHFRNYQSTSRVVRS